MKRLGQSGQLNNKGFSLIEVLVSIAVGVIVMAIIASFVLNGTGFFKRQMNSVSLQNELQEVSNKITDSLMEATSIYVYDDGTATYIFTGDFKDTITEKSDVETLAEDETWASYENKSEQRLIMWVHTGDYAGNLYVFDRDFFVSASSGSAMDIADITFASLLGTGSDAEIVKSLEGYCITKHAILYNKADPYNTTLNSLVIRLNEDCIIETPALDKDGNAVTDDTTGNPVYVNATYTDLDGHTVIAYKAPVSFTVNLNLVSGSDERSDEKVTSVRNSLISMNLYGQYYGTSYK